MNQPWAWAAILGGQTAIIIGGYALGFYFQNRRIDDLRSEINHRFDDFKDWIRAELRRIEERLDRLEHRVTRP